MNNLSCELLPVNQMDGFPLEQANAAAERCQNVET